MIKPIFRTNVLDKNIVYQFKLKILKNKLIKPATKSYQQALPLVSVPLLAYNIQSDAEARRGAMVLEHGKANHIVTDNTEKNIKALKKAGYKNVDINRELDKHGNLKNESTKKAITSKGAPDDLDAHEATLDADITGDPPQIYDENKVLSGLSAESREMLDEINNTDMSLPPDLQEIIDMPSIDTPEGFIETIFGELPDGMSVPSDIWSMLKGIADDILDFGDWF